MPGTRPTDMPGPRGGLSVVVVTYMVGGPERDQRRRRRLLRRSAVAGGFRRAEHARLCGEPSRASHHRRSRARSMLPSASSPSWPKRHLRHVDDAAAMIDLRGNNVASAVVSQFTWKSPASCREFRFPSRCRSRSLHRRPLADTCLAPERRGRGAGRSGSMVRKKPVLIAGVKLRASVRD